MVNAVWLLFIEENVVSAQATVTLQALSAVVVKEADGVSVVPVAPLSPSGAT